MRKLMILLGAAMFLVAMSLPAFAMGADEDQYSGSPSSDNFDIGYECTSDTKGEAEVTLTNNSDEDLAAGDALIRVDSGSNPFPAIAAGETGSVFPAVSGGSATVEVQGTEVGSVMIDESCESPTEDQYPPSTMEGTVDPPGTIGGDPGNDTPENTPENPSENSPENGSETDTPGESTDNTTPPGENVENPTSAPEDSQGSDTPSSQDQMVVEVLPDTGGASLFTLSVGAFLVAGGLLARRMIR